MRARLALELLARHPAVLRANHGEVAALADAAEVEDAMSLAGRFRTVVAETGPVDTLTSGRQLLHIANGSALMDRVTAMGCTASAVTGAFLAVETDPFLAAASALLVFDVAGEIAATRAQGPGSFEPELLDSLYTLDTAALQSWARLA
jgi:hydroxyethylthiazole kinase